MVEEVSLRVGIDARLAAAGADSFKRSAAEIIRSAEKLGRAVGKAGDGFDKMKKAANDNSRVLAGTVQSVRDVEIALNSLARSAGGDVLPLTDSLNALCDKLGESKKQTNGLATAFDLLGAAADIIEIVEFLRKFERVRRLFRKLIAVTRIARVAITGFGIAVGVAAVAAAPYIAVLAAIAGGAFLFERAVTRSARAQKAINEAMARGNTLLGQANNLSGESKIKRNAEAIAEFELALALNEKELVREKESQRKKEEFLKTFRELNGDPLGTLPEGSRKSLRRQVEGEQKGSCLSVTLRPRRYMFSICSV